MLGLELGEFRGERLWFLLQLGETSLQFSELRPRGRFFLELADEHIPKGAVLGTHPRIIRGLIETQHFERCPARQHPDDFVASTFAARKVT